MRLTIHMVEGKVRLEPWVSFTAQSLDQTCKVSKIAFQNFSFFSELIYDLPQITISGWPTVWKRCSKVLPPNCISEARHCGPRVSSEHSALKQDLVVFTIPFPYRTTRAVEWDVSSSSLHRAVGDCGSAGPRRCHERDALVAGYPTAICAKLLEEVRNE